jgi:hypothetical protein
MDISFNEDQVEIANQARRFLENEGPMAFVRFYDLPGPHGARP